MEIINVFIGDRIKTLREEKNVSQAELATEINISRASIVNMESGKHTVLLKRLYDIANYFDKELTDFLPDKKWVEENKNKKVRKVITYEFYE